MRMASEARRVRLRAGLAACCFAVCCARGADVTVTWTIEPTPPVTGAATLVRFDVKHDDGTPASGAQLRVEAHMTHPGMAPLFGEVTERGKGAYETRLNLSMAGPWVLVVSGQLANGRRVVKQTEVTAVQPPVRSSAE